MGGMLEIKWMLYISIKLSPDPLNDLNLTERFNQGEIFI